ncbi:selenide, water dikinase SelD [Anianabacter salinae]|uniref:selenide, water dikinase SelD n=1 Tax=Anianabacter salinae TaxID=2851023 RepID=UPI00225E24D8|nr:selenide, water dikinase SelD [Anianabacter salinae]MBV0912390.1 selenide, water dikinase SelD [Anianabacter salinae]
MNDPLPLTRDVVFIGGGHTHALVLMRWGMKPLPGARLTLINPGPTAPYTGMLPGHIAGHYPRPALDIDMVPLARHAGARLILGSACGIDRDRRRVILTSGREVPYDIASIDIGISSDLPPAFDGVEHTVPAKPLGAYADAWAAFRARALAGEAAPEIAVIGGGVGGVELSMAMAHALRQDGHAPRVTVLDRGAALPGLGARARRKLAAAMDGLGVTLLEDTPVARVTPDAVETADGTRIASAFTVAVAGARPHGWLGSTGLDLDGGFVSVDPMLRSCDPAIYAVGDCAHLAHAPVVKAGVYAVRQAPVLHHNLLADLTGRQRKSYRPQKDYLKLISMGGKTALADKWGLGLSGAVLWQWKDRIDRTFMDKFDALEPMAPPPLPRDVAAGVRAEVQGGKPMCGGCGAKVGGGVLRAALADLPTAGRDDVETRVGDDAAVLRVGGARQVLTTDHLRAFTADPWLMTRIAAVHAMGDVCAMGAAPQAVLATVILPRMTEAMQRDWMAEIMAAAAEVFGAAGAEIVGGHSSVGGELTVGFTVTGLLDGPAITLGGARAGDALILTKPLGSGTILAAEMALSARGGWVAAAWDAMQTPQGAAAAILSGAHAMTDVTGFGLAGHLRGICDASGLGARLRLADVTLMDGAETLAAHGVRSTLYPANVTGAGMVTGAEGARGALLFDPQTAGGLLAAVAADTAETLVHRLKDAGYPAAIIGEMTEGAPVIDVV